ncbi:MAG: M56 family metallopeptidase [Parvularculaceae bacterium]
MTGADFISWFGETSLAVSILIFLILAVRRTVARRFGPDAAYLLWLAPLIRLATPELSIIPAAWRQAPPPPAFDWTPAPVALDVIAATPTPTNSAPAVLFALWAIGAIGFLTLQYLRQRTFMARLVRESAEPPPEIMAEAMVIAGKAGLRRTPRIRMANGNAGPLVAGIFDPVIVLPADFSQAYTSGERQLAFAHEFAHIARGDLATTFAALFFLAAQWPNPLAHFAFRAFRADQEAACDAAVIARNETLPDISYAYGAALVKSAAQRFSAPAASLAMSNHLKERLMLLKSSTKSSAAKGRLLAAMLVAAGVAASASYSYAANDEGRKASRTSTQVIQVDDGETLTVAGAKNATKIEIKVKNGKKTVKAWDRKGKLLEDKVYDADDETPFDRVVITNKKGEEHAIDLTHPIEPPMPPEGMDWSSDDDAMAYVFGHDGAPGEHRKVIVLSGDFDGDHGADCEGAEGSTVDIEREGPDGGKIVHKEIVCIAGSGAKDPAKRAEALRNAIDHMEKQAAEETARRERMIAKLRADLAKAESEAAKK